MNPNDLSQLSLEEKKQLLKKIRATSSSKRATSHSHLFIEGLNQKVELKKRLLEEMGVMNPFFRPIQSPGRDVVCIDGKEYLNFSSYNYLGCSGDDYVNERVKEAVDQYGSSVSASPIASGNHILHEQLESMISGKLGTEASLCFVGGYVTNTSTISHLFSAQDIIFYDSLIHRSLLAGIISSGARRVPFPHNDYKALVRSCSELRDKYDNCLIVTEGVFSMDGDLPDLAELVKIRKQYDTLLMVDEAHSMGVLGKSGRGCIEHFNLAPDDIDIWMGTLSKSYASCGGYISGKKQLIEYLKYTAPGFVYSVGLTPGAAAAAIAAIQLVDQEPERVQKLQENSDFFRQECQVHGLDVGISHDSPVVPVIIGKSTHALYLADRLFKQNINVLPMFYPSVEEGQARLRFFISCLHSQQQLTYAARITSELLQEIYSDQTLIQDFPTEFT